jgi:hypothetical protein
MKTVIRSVALALLMLPALVSAQEPHPLAGNWAGSITEDGVAVPVMIELRIREEVVTGPIFMHGAEEYIRNGSVTAQAITFTTPRLNATDRDVPMVWTGEFVSGQLAFSVVAEDREGPVREFMLARPVAQ